MLSFSSLVKTDLNDFFCLKDIVFLEMSFQKDLNMDRMYDFLLKKCIFFKNSETSSSCDIRFRLKKIGYLKHELFMPCFHQYFHLTSDQSLLQSLPSVKLLTQFRKGEGPDPVILHFLSFQKIHMMLKISNFSCIYIIALTALIL